MMNACPRERVASALTLLTAAACLAGCEQKVERPALATYPVVGKVVTTGKMPVGGCVQFEPEQNGLNYMAQGVIDEAGKFSLRVPYVDRVLPGATEGPHRVRILLPLNQGGTPVPIEGSFLVRQGENEFNIQMLNHLPK